MRCPKCEIELEGNVRVCPECGAVYGASNYFFDKIARIEEILLVTLLSTMVLLVLTQIFLRNAFNSGITGGDSLIRHLVLWGAFVGAGLATREGSHVRIDVASRVLPEKWKKPIEVIIDLFSVTVCSILVYASYNFVSVEHEGLGKLPFGGIPIWIIQVIMPVGYLVVALRFASKGVRNIVNLVKGE